jgi:P4 family phage/plasmid primase-like protien
MRAVEEFRHTIEQAGLTAPETIVPDGELHRFASNGDRTDNAGWYVLHGDGLPAGSFGCFRSNLTQTWCAKSERKLTERERAEHRKRIEVMQRQRDAEERQRHTDAARRVQQLWNAAPPAPSDHPYLLKKQVRAYGLRVDRGNQLIVPVRISGAISSVQFISPDGAKKFFPDGAVKGGSFILGELTKANTILLCEGFATAASLFEASGYPVVMALSAGNLQLVAEQLRQQCPTATFVICGDHDLSGTGQRAAREAAAAVNGVVALPEEEGQDWNDIHVQRGLDAVRSAIHAAIRREGPTTPAPSTATPAPGGAATTPLGPATNSAPENQTVQRSTDDGLTKTLADEILVHDAFARDAGGQLYVFEGGAYRPHGEQQITQRVKALLLTTGDTKKWSSHRAREVVEFIRVDAPRLWDRPPADTLNLCNGLLDLCSRTLTPHTSGHFSPVQLPVTYDPTARCPRWESFLARVLPDDARTLPYELVAASMRGDVSDQTAVLLVGSGDNGKSTLLGAIVAVLGRENVASLALQRLEIDKFSVVRLLGKLANVCADLPSDHLTSTSTFKALTGGDQLTAERKFQGSFEFTPFARLLFSTNHYPQSKDSSPAFFRRWLVVPFDAVIAPQERILELAADLAAPRELSGVLNQALMVLPDIRSRGGFSQSETTRAAMMEFREMTDPLMAWLERCTTLTPLGVTSKKDLHITYGAYAEANGRPPMSPKSFYAGVKRLRPGLTEAQRRVYGEVRDVFLGIELKHRNTREMSALSAHSAHSSQISLECVEREEEREKRVIDLTGRNALNGATPLTVDIEPCFACHSTRLWKSIHGAVVCGSCHPPLSDDLVVEWIEGLQPSIEPSTVGEVITDEA